MQEARWETRLCQSEYLLLYSVVLVNANVCRIFLNATNEQALSKVSMDELKQFAVDKEA